MHIKPEPRTTKKDRTIYGQITWKDTTQELLTFNYRELCPTRIKELTDSIRTVGVQEPLQVLHVTDKNQLYVLSGHHRLAALRHLESSHAHLKIKFPLIIHAGVMADLDSPEITLKRVVTNLITPKTDIFERATCYQLLREQGYINSDIASIVGTCIRTISKIFVLNRISSEQLKELKNSNLSETRILYCARKFERDPNFNLKEYLQPKKKPASVKIIPVDSKIFRSKLESAGILPKTINKVMSLL